MPRLPQNSKMGGTERNLATRNNNMKSRYLLVCRILGVQAGIGGDAFGKNRLNQFSSGRGLQ
jgi:hypothetical protein